LQLAQALLAQGIDWLHALLHKRQMKLHVYHLDAEGGRSSWTAAPSRAPMSRRP